MDDKLRIDVVLDDEQREALKDFTDEDLTQIFNEEFFHAVEGAIVRVWSGHGKED